MSPVIAIPDATPIMFASAIPHSKYLSGNSAAKASIFSEPFRSAARATTLGSAFPAR